MAKHALTSPGPWLLDGNEILYTAKDGKHYVVCNFIGDMYDQQGNARLIAAAPDLLNALEIFLGHSTGGMDGNWANCDPREVARAAIAKVNGNE